MYTSTNIIALTRIFQLVYKQAQSLEILLPTVPYLYKVRNLNLKKCEKMQTLWAIFLDVKKNELEKGKSS